MNREAAAEPHASPGTPCPERSEGPGSKVSSDRIVGFDLARSLAILGMVLVHFAMVMSFERMHQGPLGQIVRLLDGRAAATFVVLAGIGLTLRSRRATAAGDGAAVRSVRATVLKRGAFLLIVGHVNLLIWQGDILRVYGVSLAIAACLLTVGNRALWAVTFAFVAGFIALFFVFDYSARWDWQTMEYRGLWTPAGIVRNLFYDGFRSVFSWTGLLIVGMWVGRHDLRSPNVRRRFLLGGVLLLAAAELASRLLVHLLQSGERPVKREEAVYLVGTESMPPLPLFLLSATGAAVAVIAACIGVAERFPSAAVVRALVATGQLAFTWYVGHIVLGLGTVVALGMVEDRPLAIGLGTGLGFFGVAVVLSLLWRLKFRHGPLEWLMRRLAG